MNQSAGQAERDMPRSRTKLWDVLSCAPTALFLPVLALQRFLADQALQKAAALTCATLLSITSVPVVGLALLGSLDLDQETYGYISNLLSPVFPAALRDKFFYFFARVDFKALAAAGLFFFLVSIAMAVSTLKRPLHTISDTKRQRSVIRELISYLGLFFFAPLLLVIIVSATAVFQIRWLIASMGSVWILGVEMEILLKLISLGGSILLVTLILYVLPSMKIRFLPGLAGGVVGGVLIFFLAWSYVSIQVGYIAAKMVIFAVLTQLPILMVWIFLGWCILFYSAEVAAIVQGGLIWSIAGEFRQED